MRTRTLSPNSPVLGIERSLQSLEDLLERIHGGGELVPIVNAHTSAESSSDELDVEPEGGDL